MASRFWEQTWGAARGLGPRKPEPRAIGLLRSPLCLPARHAQAYQPNGLYLFCIINREIEEIFR